MNEYDRKNNSKIMPQTNIESNTLGIFGGSFNPPHKSHREIARQIIISGKVDELLIVPAYQNPLKLKEEMMPDDVRLEMVRLTFQNLPKTKLLFSEINRGGSSYTVETLEEIKKQRNVNIKLFLGSDTFNLIHKWKDFQLLPKLADIVIFQRKCATMQSLLTINPKLKEIDYDYLDIDVPEISSTLIRELGSNPKALQWLHPPAKKIWTDFISKQNKI